MSDSHVIIVDNGSSTIKAGFSGDSEPCVLFPTVVGTPKFMGNMFGGGSNEIFIGDEALSKKAIVNLQFPVENGLVSNWDGWEKVMHHLFHDKLKVAPEDHTVLLTTSHLVTGVYSEKLFEIMFEKFNTKAVCLANPSALCLQKAGLKTGLVVHSGQDTTSVVPIHDGKPIGEATQTSFVAGSDVTKNIVKLLHEKNGDDFSTAWEMDRDIILNIKKNVCYTAPDFENEMKRENDKEFEMPDGQVIKIGNISFRAPEVLFKPSLIGIDSEGVHTITHNAIQQCEENILENLYGSIVLSGGSTRFSGFGKRLHSELSSLAPPTTNINVINPEDRKYTTWKGGAMFASTPEFRDLLVSKEEYAESGASVVGKKYS